MGDSKKENTPKAEKGSVKLSSSELTRVMQAIPKFKRSTQDLISGTNVVS